MRHSTNARNISSHAASAAILQTQVPGSSFEALRQSLVEHGTWTGELRHRVRDGRILTVESQIELVQVGDRTLVLESTRDVTDRNLWEERQRLLLNELTHRVRNTLAVVQALARETLRTVGREDFLDRFVPDMSAQLAARDGAELRAMPFGVYRQLVGTRQRGPPALDPSRLEITGEPVTLPPDCPEPRLVTRFELESVLHFDTCHNAVGELTCVSPVLGKSCNLRRESFFALDQALSLAKATCGPDRRLRRNSITAPASAAACAARS